MAALSDQQLWQLSVSTFGPQLAPTMYAVARAESGGDPGAYNPRGEDSVGLWQINRRAWPQFSHEMLSTPEGNAAAARQVLAKQGLGAWTTYTGGQYRQYVPNGGGNVVNQTSGATGGYDPWGGGDATGPVTRQFPDGTFRALKPGTDPSDSGNWTILASKDLGDPEWQPPQIEYDAQGRAWAWVKTPGPEGYASRVFYSELDDPKQAAGYAPPISPYQQATLGNDQQRLGIDQQRANTDYIGTMGGLQVQQEQLRETVRNNIAEDARDNVMLRLQQDTARVQEEQGNRRLALEAQGLIEQTMTRIQNNRLERERLTAAAAQVDKQIAANAAAAQADRMFQGGENAANRQQQASEGVADRNLTREGIAANDAQERARLGLQRDTAISEYAREPGDVGVVSALLNRGGLSNLSTAIGGGETAITDRSLEPLASLLAPGPAAYQPRYEQAPGPISQAMYGGGDVAGAQARALAAAQGAAPPAPAQPSDWMTYLTEGGVPEWARTEIGAPNVPGPGAPGVPRAQEGAAVVEPGVLNGLMALVQALGLEPKAVAGERGKSHGETVYADPGANVVIAPDKGKGGAGHPMMADGGAVWDYAAHGGDVDAPFGRDEYGAPKSVAGGEAYWGGYVPPGSPMSTGPNVPTPLTVNQLLAQARAFMERTAATTLQRSGFAQAPTPISLSDPGTDPFRQRLGAATTATVKGIPQQSFLNELMRLRPRGQQFGIGGRTR